MKLVCFSVVLIFTVTVQGQKSKIQCTSKFGMILDDNCEQKWQCVWGKPVLMPGCMTGMVYNRFGTCVVKGLTDDTCNTGTGAKQKPKGVCSRAPCRNGGTCNDWEDGQSFTCTCPWGYAGEFCETRTMVDPCSSGPCKNGATCNAWGDRKTYSCTCQWGYRGETCEEELMHRLTITPCMSYPCKNEGICKNSLDGKSYECVCQENFRGVNCEREPTVEDRCEMNPKLVFAHPENCHQFYNCSFQYENVPMYFEQHLDECPYPLLFSTISNSCKNFTEVQCGTRSEEKDACGYLRNICPVSHCEPCYINYPSCEEYSDGLHEHSYKKRPWYMVCNKGRVVDTGLCPYDVRFRAQSYPKDGKCSTEE